MEKIKLTRLMSQHGRWWYVQPDYMDDDLGDPLFVYPAGAVDRLVEAGEKLLNEIGWMRSTPDSAPIMVKQQSEILLQEAVDHFIAALAEFKGASDVGTD